MQPLWLHVLSIFITSTFFIITSVNGNGYNLKELYDTRYPLDPITTNLQELKLLEYVISLEQRGYGDRGGSLRKLLGGSLKTPPEKPSTFFIPRLTHTKQANVDRMRPQYIITYYAPLKSIIVYFIGTIRFSKAYDWANIINVVPKEIKLRRRGHRFRAKIEVHGGVYNAVNTELFYKGSRKHRIHSFVYDLQKMINNVHKYHMGPISADNAFKTPIERIYFTVHSQGGAIATLLTVLWQSRVDCEFFRYFWGRASPELKRIMDNAKVITFGAPGIFGHDRNGRNVIDYIYHHKIWNVINAQDPIPMSFNGKQPKPTSILQENDDSPIDVVQFVMHKQAQAFIDEFDDKAYYGPVGKYMVIMEQTKWWFWGTKDVFFKEFNARIGGWLWDKHLVNGAHTLENSDLNVIEKLLRTLFDHSTEEYRKPILYGVKKYGDKLKKGKSGFWIMIYSIEMVLFLVVCCAVCGLCIGHLIGKFVHGRKPKMGVSPGEIV